MYKDALSNADEYENIIQKIAELKAKKIAIEDRIKNQLGKAWEKFEDLTYEEKVQLSLMTDIAMTNLMDGKTVEIIDAFSNKYEPVWSVKFKKTNIVKEK